MTISVDGKYWYLVPLILKIQVWNKVFGGPKEMKPQSLLIPLLPSSTGVWSHEYGFYGSPAVWK